MAKLTKIEPWMVESAYGVAAMLPADPREAVMVLSIVSMMIREINTKLQRKRRQRKAGR